MESDVAPDFPQRLRQLRKDTGLSLRALGERAHVSRGFLWDLEAGKKRPSPTTATQLDRALDAGGELVALATPAPRSPRSMYPSPVDQIEALRRQVTDSISSS